MSVKQGFVAIANEVLDDVEKEAEAIIVAAETEAKETIKAAKEQAHKNFRSIIEEAKIRSETESRKLASVTEVETRNRLLQTKEELVENAFSNSLEKLKKYLTTEDYHQYLLQLIESIAKRISQKRLIVQVNEKDKGWLTLDILNCLSAKLTLELQLSDQVGNFIGGCKIQTIDGKLTYDATIDNRLQRLKPTLRIEIAKTLFGKES